MILILVILIDQASKYFVYRKMALGTSHPVLPGWLHITHHNNTGAAFGLFEGNAPILILISFFFIVFLITYLCLRRGSPLKRASLVLILGGAIGNTIDRLSRGYVVDFIDLRVWPIFNVADMAISVGVGILLGIMILGRLQHANR